MGINVTERSGRPLSTSLVQEILSKTIWWSDGQGCHYFFDFVFQNKFWVSSVEISNELDNFIVEVEPV